MDPKFKCTAPILLNIHFLKCSSYRLHNYAILERIDQYSYTNKFPVKKRQFNTKQNINKRIRDICTRKIMQIL